MIIDQNNREDGQTNACADVDADADADADKEKMMSCSIQPSHAYHVNPNQCSSGTHKSF